MNHMQFERHEIVISLGWATEHPAIAVQRIAEFAEEYRKEAENFKTTIDFSRAGFIKLTAVRK